MADESFEERTEEPTAMRREELRRQGDVLQSRELVGTLLLLAATGSLYGASRWALGGVWMLFEESFGELSRLGTTDWSPTTITMIAKFVFRIFAYVVAPVALSALVAAIGATFAQVGFVWTTRPLEFDPTKLDPSNGAKRLFGMDGAYEMAKAVVKFVVIGAVAWPFLSKWARQAGSLYGSDPQVIASFLGSKIVAVLFVMGLAMLCLAAVDYGFQRLRYERRIRMTKEEVRQERKQVEGNPQIRARIRGLQRANSQRRMMDDVRKADVVITNPTHFAVAIIYDRESMFAPKVVAKGADHLALRIKEVAREAGIPCVENVPLARALYKALKIGQFISRDMYNAVAEVLAYVYRLKGRTS